jgi:hypothetical protein
MTYDYNLSRDGDLRRGFIPMGNGDGKQISPQMFMGIPSRKKIHHEDGEQFLNGKFPIAIPSQD